MTDSRNHKFLSIQALRFVAAFLVLFTHSTFFASERLDNQFLTWERGVRGVDIFFVISGFVMIYSSQRLFTLSDGWKIFAQHRVLRIVPLYWLVTTLKVLFMLFTVGLAEHARLSPVTAACSYLFLPSKTLDGKIAPIVGVGWTLTFEMFFYFLFALALFLRVNVFKFAGAILILLSIGAYFRQPSWPSIAFYLNTVVLEFFLGMLIAKACISGIHIPKKAAFWLLACGFILLLAPGFDWNLPKILLCGVPASLIIWSAASLGSLENSIPRFVLYLGDASYSIYLIHSVVSPLAPTVLNHLHLLYPWLSVFLSIVLGLGAGCIVYEFIELPMTNRLKGYLKVRSASPRITA